MKCALLLVLAAVLPFLGSCGKSAGSDVAGTYKFDTTAIEADMMKELEGMPEDRRAMAEAFIKPMVAGLAEGAYTFNDDNTLEATMPGSVMKGTWKLEGDRITITTTEEGGDPKTEEKIGTFADGTISFTEQGPEGKSLTFILKKE